MDYLSQFFTEKVRISTNIQKSYKDLEKFSTPTISINELEKALVDDVSKTPFYTEDIIKSYCSKAIKGEDGMTIEKAEKELAGLSKIITVGAGGSESIYYPTFNTETNEFLKNPINTLLGREGKIVKE
jgi:hypothetical protein